MMHSHYWSCSRFADWLRGTPKLKAGTAKEWRDWRNKACTAYPIRYWLAEELLGKIQDFVSWPREAWNNIRYYINNRWVSRSHSLTAHPGDIRPGSWCDVGDRFLPCLFNELVDFVEVETAAHHVLWDDEAREKYGLPWWRSGWLRWRTWRCAEAGLSHLEWAKGLHIDESCGVNPGEQGYGEPTQQAQNAQEILELYHWWTKVRPNRPDPYEVSGWSAICERRRERFDGIIWEDENKKDRSETRQSLDVLRKLEEQYEKEDEDMMIRLIRARRALWT